MKEEKLAKTLMYPNAAAQGMAEMMEFIRQQEWRPQINRLLIKRLGIATSNEGQVLSALRFLGFIDANGNPTPDFDEAKKDFPSTMKRVVLKQYADLFAILPPAMITRKRLKSFFNETAENEEPGQGADKRARFFIWLCGQAGIELPGIAREADHSD